MNPALQTLVLALREHGSGIGKGLFMGAEPHPQLQEMVGWQPLKDLTDLCELAGMRMVRTIGGEFENVLFLPGKSKEEVLAGFATAHDVLRPGGRLVVSMANTAGAARFEKELEQVTPLLFSVSKHKCRAFGVEKTSGWNATRLSEWRELSEPKTIPGTSFRVMPGIFSTKHIDPGSALLAECLPASMRGKVADLGAGWGYLSQMVLEKSSGVSRIDLFEADWRALECAKANVRGNAAFHWHDVRTGLPGTYDHVVCNPPFHTGQARDLDLGRAFLSVAAASLRPGGTLHVVANRQLAYEAHLSKLGLRSRLMAENHAYKVIFATR